MLILVTAAISILDYLLEKLHRTWQMIPRYLPGQYPFLFYSIQYKPQKQLVSTNKGPQTGCLLSHGAPSTLRGVTIIMIQGL